MLYDMEEKEMNERQKSPTEVKYLTSLIVAVNDIDDHVKHLQFTVIQETDSKEIRCFFDVVDPSRVKLADSEI